VANKLNHFTAPALQQRRGFGGKINLLIKTKTMNETRIGIDNLVDGSQ